MANESNSPTDLINQALDLLGRKKINTIETPQTDEEKLAARWYYDSHYFLLESGSFNFATKRAKLVRNATQPAFGDVTAFKLPADFLSLLSIGEDSARKRDGQRIEGTDLILYEFYSADSGVQLPVRYIGKENNVATFSPTYKRALVFFIAMTISYEISGKDSQVQKFEAMFEKYFKKAQVNDGRSSPIVVVERSDFVTFRGRASRRDPRYYDDVGY